MPISDKQCCQLILNHNSLVSPILLIEPTGHQLGKRDAKDLKMLTAVAAVLLEVVNSSSYSYISDDLWRHSNLLVAKICSISKPHEMCTNVSDLSNIT